MECRIRPDRGGRRLFSFACWPGFLRHFPFLNHLLFYERYPFAEYAFGVHGVRTSYSCFAKNGLHREPDIHDTGIERLFQTLHHGGILFVRASCLALGGRRIECFTSQFDGRHVIFCRGFSRSPLVLPVLLLTIALARVCARVVAAPAPTFLVRSVEVRLLYGC